MPEQSNDISKSTMDLAMQNLLKEIKQDKVKPSEDIPFDKSWSWKMKIENPQGVVKVPAIFGVLG